MRNNHFIDTMNQLGLTPEHLAELTTIDLPVIQNLAAGEYPMSPQVSELFHQVGGITGQEWRTRTNKHFKPSDLLQTTQLLRKSLTTKEIGRLARSGMRVEHSRFKKKSYNAVINYRIRHGIQVPCPCGNQSYNGECTGCKILKRNK